MTTQVILEIIKQKFPEEQFEIQQNPGGEILIVPAKILRELCFFLRDDERLAFDYLMNLSGVDLADGEKKKDENGLIEIVGGHLATVYHLYSFKHNHKLNIKVLLPRENPIVPSIERVWRAADWFEREAYDMFGIIFEGHHNLKRILLPNDWEGYPLRKDYKVQEFYHGMKVPY